MNVRLLAGSQSSHAPHPALSRCLNDLGVFLAAFPQRVEMMEKGNEMKKKTYNCPNCGVVSKCEPECFDIILAQVLKDKDW